jgi:hypothetical protein
MIGSINRTLRILYQGQQKQISIAERNSAIYHRYQAGETFGALVLAYGISLQRIHQIVSSKDKQPSAAYGQ